jgi:hypothetical protein
MVNYSKNQLNYLMSYKYLSSTSDMILRAISAAAVLPPPPWSTKTVTEYRGS